MHHHILNVLSQLVLFLFYCDKQYVTLEHKTSQFYEIEIYASSE